MARSGMYNGGSNRPSMADMTVGEYANGVPTIRVGAMIRSLLRKMIFVIIGTLIGAVLIFYLTSGVKRTYQGEGRLLAQLGEEYIFNQVGSDSSNQGMMITADVITANEAAIMKNSEVIDQVIGQMTSEFGEDVFAKEAYAKIRRAEASGDVIALNNARVELRKQVERNYAVIPQPKSSIVDVVYTHENGEVAVQTVNAFIDAYLDYRRTIFIEGSGEQIADRRITTEKNLAEIETEIRSFLRRNGISDFNSERGGATSRTELLRAELNTLRANLAETEAALASTEGSLRQTPPEIDLYTDDRAGQRVAQAELELKQLLAKYLPGSDPVRAKQTEIRELKSLQQANGGNAVGGRRVGPNPVYQEMLTRRNNLQATADAYREKEFALQQQLNATDAKVRKLQNLSPEYNNLIRERDILDERLKDYNNKEQAALVNQEQSKSASENVKVISYASLPRKGRNMRKILFVLGTLAWAFTLFMGALLAVFLDPNLYHTPSVRLKRASDGYRDPMPQEYDRRPATQPYIPEPVPAAATASVAYGDPGGYHSPPPQPATAYTGSAAHDIYAHEQPASAPIATMDQSPVQIIGTVPSNEQS